MTNDSLTAWMGDGDEPHGIESQALLAGLRRQMFGVADTEVRVGKYRLLEEIGRGGMGIVYRAHDEELQRDVAVKVLLSTGATHDRRLQREAQAMARLSHPNVVQVLEVGRHNGQMFVAMELVSGRDAAAWLAERPRSWREIVAVFGAAGEGLAAAHQRGLVHRDFKPSNVLVGTDGRVRVTDFGLVLATDASPASARASEPAPRDRSSPEPGRGSTSVTGGVLGTPRYMAPEQSRGERVDARADQWSFAVSLWEAACGRRPEPWTDAGAAGTEDGTNAGPGAASVGLALASLGRSRRSRRSRPPARLLRVLGRALATDPAARYPSMQQLLARLRAVAARRQRMLWVVGLGALGSSVWVGIALPPQTDHATPNCNPDEHSATMWTRQRQRRLAAAFVATDVPFARRAWSDVQARVDPWIDAWNETYQRTCEASREEASVPLEVDRKLLCLRGELAEVGGLLDVFAEPDREVVVRANAATRDLPRLSRCRDPQGTATANLAEFRAHTRLEAATNVQFRAGRYHKATRVARRAVAAVTDPALRSIALTRLGMSLKRDGKLDESRGPLEEGFEAAAAIGNASRAADAALGLMQLSIVLSESDDADR